MSLTLPCTLYSTHLPFILLCLALALTLLSTLLPLTLRSIVLPRFFHVQHLHWLFRLLCSPDSSIYSTSTDSSVYCALPILPFTAPPLTLQYIVLPRFFPLQHFHWFFRLLCSPDSSIYSPSTDSSVYCAPLILPFTGLPLTLPSTVLPWIFQLCTVPPLTSPFTVLPLIFLL